MDKAEILRIRAEVQEKRAKRDACPLHEYERTAAMFKARCRNCGTDADFSAVALYTQGLQHGRVHATGGGIIEEDGKREPGGNT